MKKVGPPQPLKVLRSASLVQHRIVGIVCEKQIFLILPQLYRRFGLGDVSETLRLSVPTFVKRERGDKDGTAVVLNAG